MSLSLPRVSILIVSWNGKEYLKVCLSSLQNLHYPEWEVILVDNGSSDGTTEFVKKKFPQVRVIENWRNLGFARANNQAFERSRGKYVLLLNNDTRVEPDFLTPLVQRMEADESLGAVQPLILSWDGQRVQSTGSFFTPSGFLYHRGYRQDRDYANFLEPGPIFAAQGSALLLRRELIVKIGLFDESYLMYFEESDLSHRVWLSGHRVFFEPSGVVYHRGGGTVWRHPRSRVQFHSFKNRLQTYLKNLGSRQLLSTLPRHLLYLQLASGAYLLIKRDLSLAWAVQRAIFWNLLHLKEILKKRAWVQEQVRRVPDRDYLPQVSRKVSLGYYLSLLMG